MQIIFTTKEAAEFIRLSPATLEVMRKDGRGPKWSNPSGGKILYMRDDLEAWVRGESQ